MRPCPPPRLHAAPSLHGLPTLTLLLVGGASIAAGCDSEANAPVTPPLATGGSAGAGASAGGTGGVGGLSISGGNGTGGQGGADACTGFPCPDDQHCELEGGEPTCVNSSCEELECTPPERCETTSGGGALCVDASCSEDVDCAPAEYCDGVMCQADVCEPGALRCTANGEVWACDANGGGESGQWACGSDAYFESTCHDDNQGNAFCDCEDDWDCAPHTWCEAGACTGTGVPPTCFLEPEPFTNVLPVQEIVWGGDPPYPGQSTYAAGSPYPASAQVVMTPLVANLDDDNGDGLINELDFPEILFITFCDHVITSDGVLRAIHGGGPNKGLDFFATASATSFWHEGDPMPVYACTDAELDSTSSLAVGDLDADGVPEIVGITEGAGTNGSARIFSNTGEVVATSPSYALNGANPAPTLANVDNTGLAEIVIGRHVLTLAHDSEGVLTFVDHFEGTANVGTNGQGPVSCVANVLGDERQEIIAGGTVYVFPRPPAGAATRADCTQFPPVTAEEQAFCNGQLYLDAGSGNGWSANVEGFCAVADVLGADQAAAPGPNNPLDGVPEVVLVSAGSLRVYNGQDGTSRRTISLSAGTLGGAPNVDDFDGDGFPEIGTAAATAYVVFDLQDTGASCPPWPGVNNDNTTTPRTPPATACATDADCGDLAQFACNEALSSCVCLHNGWRRTTEDDSSQVTGSSVFDFNGDGAAEVIYNDECRFRIYDGLDGTVLFSPASESRTRIEYPVVADVDNDGNAEIVFPTTNESGFCSQNLDNQYNNGIEVWGDSGDYWVAARRIWNQHAYHVTNVTEAGALPLHEPESWLEYGERQYNIYRSNPRNLGIAPDLVVAAVQVSSPDAVCGQLSSLLDITVQLENRGDLRVGPGVVVSFVGDWPAVPLTEPLHADGVQTPLELVLAQSIEPGDSIFVVVPYDAVNNSPNALPATITVTVDATNLERECLENNNALVKSVEPGTPMPDLVVELGVPSAVNCPTIPTTVRNLGSADASNVLVRFFAGNPSQGGYALHDVVFPGPIAAAGGSVSEQVQIPGFPQATPIVVWAWVDPENDIAECNDGNNQDAAESSIQCGGIR